MEVPYKNKLIREVLLAVAHQSTNIVEAVSDNVGATRKRIYVYLIDQTKTSLDGNFNFNLYINPTHHQPIRHYTPVDISKDTKQGCSRCNVPWLPRDESYKF